MKFKYLTHPILLLALFLTALNDHYLKYIFSNFITGKLSDFTGVFYFPLFLYAILDLIYNPKATTRTIVLKNFLFTSLVLTAYALVTIATSKAIPNSDEVKVYSYTSNCNTATTTSGQIEVLNTSIVSPSNLDYTDLGFPVANITLGNDVSGELAPSVTRLCTYSSNTNLGITTLTYTCSDNSISACVITLLTQ